MTLTTPYSATFYVGDGERKTFPYLFDEVSENFINVIVYNALTGQSSTPTYVIDTDQKQVIFGDDTPAPTADETVCIYRNTPNVQDVPFRTLHGYDAKTLENILSKIVAMIQEIKSNYFTTQVLQGDPWQLDLLSDDDDGATINIDYTAKKLVKGLYFRITDGNLQVSADGSNYITMPKSTDVAEFRQEQTEMPDHTYQYRLQYRVGNTWYNAESNAEATADEAKQIAEEARDIANDAKDIAQDAKDTVDTFDDRLTQAESDASNAKSTVDNHVQDYNNPHQVSKAQVGLGNVDNTADLDKPIIIKSNTIPVASAEVAGKIYQYSGETNATYGHGYIYECKETPVDSLTFTPNTISCSWADLSTFLQGETQDYNDVVGGTMTYYEDADLWALDAKDSNGNTILAYQQYTGDWESVGFTFTGTFADGAVVSFVRTTESTYAWVRIDVQPNTAVWGSITGTITNQTDLVNYVSGVESGLQSQINTINGKIPSQASSTNQLADKDFVNSSISTATATFRGTYNSVAELEAYSGAKDLNDYAFVISTDTAGNTLYNRYKYDGSNWVFEYALNNSSFTANQWAAINSGATSTNIAQIGTNTNDIATNKGTMDSHIANTSNPHSVTKAQVGLGNVDNTSDLDKPISTATQTALNAKADKTNRVNGSPLSTAVATFYGTSTTAAATVQKEVSIPSITTLDIGTIIIVQPTETSTVANSTLKLNDFPAYPMRYNNAAITTSTDSIVWGATFPSVWVFDGTYWVFAGHGLDSNTTYTMNYTLDAGRYKAGTGTYAVTRYSLLMEKADGTWEKITATNANYSTGTSKNVNTNGFRLNHIRWYNTTAAVANGALIATNTLQNKAASVNLSYSANCGTAPGWAVGDYIYLVGTIGADGLFYLDTTQWWSNTLPNTNDGKLYIRLGIALTATDSTMSFFDDRPIYYHDGTGIKEYKVADNKQDLISDLATIRSGASAGATAVQPGDLAAVATTGDYTDLLNKPTIPAAQVNSDWNAVSGVAEILNKPTLAAVATSGLYSDLTGTPSLAAVATSGSYNDLLNKPTIPTVNNATITITQGGVTKGSFTLNQASGDTIELDAGGGGGSSYHPDLFDVKWADHICNDVQWLRADTFSWQSGAVYQAAYQHLEDDIDGKTLQSETIAGITIQFYLADDGHKICPASEESNVASIYSATGVAWYYIIDTANTRFKLPRTQFAFTGIRSDVGAFVEAGLPNITGTFNQSAYSNIVATGAFGTTSKSGKCSSGSDSKPTGTFDASRCSSIYGNSDTVQPKATEMYLYFYVGNFTQTAIENTAGITTEEMNNKVNIGHEVIEFQEPTSANNYTWYRKYRDGWVEQGGQTTIPSAKYIDVTLPIPMQDNHYTPMITASWSATATGQNEGCEPSYKTNTTMRLTASYAPVVIWWQVSGMAA